MKKMRSIFEIGIASFDSMSYESYDMIQLERRPKANYHKLNIEFASLSILSMQSLNSFSSFFDRQYNINSLN